MRRRRPASPRLFEPEDLALKRTGVARLAALARLPALPLSEQERRRSEDVETMQRLRTWGEVLAREFKLSWSALEPEHEGVTEHYGVCYEDGLIRIRLRHARTGRLLKESSLADTLCHELAHLRHLDHRAGFKKLYARILDRARALGYYRPGPTQRKPVQASLFELDVCGTISSTEGEKGHHGTSV
jgi:hypothetical protein